MENPFDSLEPTVRRDSSDLSPRAPSLVSPAEEDGPEAEAGQREWEATVSRDILVGKKLGDFVVKRRIGAGGMGIVYEGEHPIIGRKVAIKILRPEFSEGGGARDLVAEARAASAIRHRGIIDVFGFGTIPGVGQYLVMEFLEGSPLDEVIHQRAPMLELEVVGLLDELLAALGAAHAKGVIHRDLKPGNIFVVRDSTDSESVKVLDFGLAKQSEMPHGTSPQTRASMIVGTPEYMAPEQACGQPVGPHTDLYSVGVIAFEMLTRRLPFEGTSPMAIAIQHVQARPPAPSTFVDLHPALDALVLKLLAKTAAQRPASADAVRRELKGIMRELADGATRIAPGGAPTTELEQVHVPSSARDYDDGAPAPRNSRPLADSVTITRKTPPPAEAVSVTQPRNPLPTEALPARPARKAAPAPQEALPARPASKDVPETDRIAPVRSRGPKVAVLAGLVVLLAGVGVWAMRPRVSPEPGPPVANGDLTGGLVPIKPPEPPSTGEPGVKPPVEAGPATPPSTEPPPSGGTPEQVAQRNDTPRPPQPTATQTTQSGRPAPRPSDKGADTGVAVSRMGSLRVVVVRSWADIWIDGKQRAKGKSAVELELEAGSHTLELINSVAGAKHTKRILIKGGKTVVYEVKLAGGEFVSASDEEL